MSSPSVSVFVVSYQPVKSPGSPIIIYDQDEAKLQRIESSSFEDFGQFQNRFAQL